MELLKTVKRRTFWSEIAYYVLNIGLAATLLVIAQTIQSPYPALALVVLSKWRVIAVRPRFWWANIQANTVDMIVGVGVVGLMYLPGVTTLVRVLLAIFYALWLVVIKPMSKRWQVTLQAAVAVITGTIALMAVSYDWPVSAVVSLMFLIGYSTARHFLYSHDEEMTVQLSVVWGIIFAEFGWLGFYWNYGYSTALAGGVGGVPQVTIILLLISFCAERAYKSWKKHQTIRLSDVIGPVILSVLLIGLMLTIFNSVVI